MYKWSSPSLMDFSSIDKVTGEYKTYLFLSVFNLKDIDELTKSILFSRIISRCETLAQVGSRTGGLELNTNLFRCKAHFDYLELTEQSIKSFISYRVRNSTNNIFDIDENCGDKRHIELYDSEFKVKSFIRSELYAVGFNNGIFTLLNESGKLVKELNTINPSDLNEEEEIKNYFSYISEVIEELTISEN